MGLFEVIGAIAGGLYTIAKLAVVSLRILSRVSQEKEYDNIQALFTDILAYVAQSDNTLNQKEKRVFSQLWKQMFGVEISNKKLENFCQGIDSDEFEDFLFALEVSHASQKHSSVDILEILEASIILAEVDSPLNKTELECIERISRILNIDDADVARLVQDYRQNTTNKGRFYSYSDTEEDTSQNEKANESQDPYKILGVRRSASMEEINAAYRSLSKQFHPDMISSKDLNPDFIRYAEKRFIEIDSAYRALKKSHSR
jgi:DnaJ like chaperone protein